MLHVRALCKTFDGFKAVNNANLTAAQGEIIAVIGPNGAGKTTLFHLITGQVKPSSGKILFKDQPIENLPPHVICRKGISRSYQVVNIFDRLTVFENVQVAVLARRRKAFNFFSAAKHMARQETEQILENVALTGKAHNICGALSHGDRKVLEIAIALGNRPELLILDEPTAGMSPEETQGTLRLIKKLNQDLGLTIVFCEHDMEIVFSLADHIMVMQQGKSIIQAEPNIIRNNSEVQKAYLGGGNYQ